MTAPFIATEAFLTRWITALIKPFFGAQIYAINF
jgi:hypothetical protein